VRTDEANHTKKDTNHPRRVRGHTGPLPNAVRVVRSLDAGPHIQVLVAGWLESHRTPDPSQHHVYYEPESL